MPYPKLTPSLDPIQDLSHFESLPAELIQEISSYLDYVDKTTLSAVSQQLNYLLGPIQRPTTYWLRFNSMRLASEHPDVRVRVCGECFARVSCDPDYRPYCAYFELLATSVERKEAVDAVVGFPNLGHRCRPRDTKYLGRAACLTIDRSECPHWSRRDREHENLHFNDKNWQQTILCIVINAYALFHVILIVLLLVQLLQSCWEFTQDESTADLSRVKELALIEVRMLEFAYGFMLLTWIVTDIHKGS